MILTRRKPKCVTVTVLLCLIAFCNACITTKDVTYFNDIQDSTLQPPAADLEIIIRPNDILSIMVSSLNPEASAIFNTTNASTTTSYPIQSTPTTTQVTGYLVSLEGMIEFPILGNIKVAGLAKRQLKDLITKMLVDQKLLVDPIVDVRYLNFRVSVLGEVGRPGVVTVPSEKISVLEALALAGDLTIYAQRDNVTLIRDENGKRIVKRLDFKSENILTSPYYYLKSNDVIYVEPNKSKVGSSRRTTLWLPVVFSFFSFAIIVVDRLDHF